MEGEDFSSPFFIRRIKMLYIVDTNVLLDFPQIVEDKEHKIIIPTSVLQELDALKKHVNQDTSSNARRAAIYVSRNVDTLNWYNCDRFGKASS